MDDRLVAELTGAEVRDGTLYVDYAVDNRSEEAVTIGGRLSRAGLHTSLQPGPVLLVRRPFGEGPETLAPGAHYAETLELPLPVPPRHPIAPQHEGEPHEVSQISVAFDYVLGDHRIKTIGPVEVEVTTTISEP